MVDQKWCENYENNVGKIFKRFKALRGSHLSSLRRSFPFKYLQIAEQLLGGTQAHARTLLEVDCIGASQILLPDFCVINPECIEMRRVPGSCWKLDLQIIAFLTEVVFKLPSRASDGYLRFSLVFFFGDSCVPDVRYLQYF